MSKTKQVAKALFAPLPREEYKRWLLWSLFGELPGFAVCFGLGALLDRIARKQRVRRQEENLRDLTDEHNRKVMDQIDILGARRTELICNGESDDAWAAEYTKVNAELVDLWSQIQYQ